MSYIFYNPNPIHQIVGDCVIRAISKLTGETWDDVYTDVTLQGLVMKDMPSSNRVWERYLKSIGYTKYLLPDKCPDCYTVIDFCRDHPYGKYLLAIGNHVVAVENGNYYDTWDSGYEIPIHYWKKSI